MECSPNISVYCLYVAKVWPSGGYRSGFCGADHGKAGVPTGGPQWSRDPPPAHGRHLAGAHGCPKKAVTPWEAHTGTGLLAGLGTPQEIHTGSFCS